MALKTSANVFPSWQDLESCFVFVINLLHTHRVFEEMWDHVYIKCVLELLPVTFGRLQECLRSLCLQNSDSRFLNDELSWCHWHWDSWIFTKIYTCYSCKINNSLKQGNQNWIVFLKHTTQWSHLQFLLPILVWWCHWKLLKSKKLKVREKTLKRQIRYPLVGV